MSLQGASPSSRTVNSQVGNPSTGRSHHPHGNFLHPYLPAGLTIPPAPIGHQFLSSWPSPASLTDPCCHMSTCPRSQAASWLGVRRALGHGLLYPVAGLGSAAMHPALQTAVGGGGNQKRHTPLAQPRLTRISQTLEGQSWEWSQGPCEREDGVQV